MAGTGEMDMVGTAGAGDDLSADDLVALFEGASIGAQWEGLLIVGRISALEKSIVFGKDLFVTLLELLTGRTGQYGRGQDVRYLSNLLENRLD